MTKQSSVPASQLSRALFVVLCDSMAFSDEKDRLQHGGNIPDKFVSTVKSIFTNEKQAIYSKCRK